jgi:hypothetical protein
MASQKVALIVHSCDRYELLFRGFEYFFRRNWDFDIPVRYYFATEEVSVDMPNFENIKSGKGEWSDRLRLLLEQVEEEYILYFQEDMWLNKPVDREFINALICKATSNKWMQVKLNSSEVFKTIPSGLSINGFEVAKLDIQHSGFLMSHQVTLWNKKFLMDQLKPKEHPWRNERKGTKRLRKLDVSIYHLDYFAENGQPPINKNAAQVKRSEYQSISMNACIKENALPFIEILEQDPVYAEYGTKLRYNYENQVTHDGKPRPLKKDIFKRMKDWLTVRA